MNLPKFVKVAKLVGKSSSMALLLKSRCAVNRGQEANTESIQFPSCDH
jgi:hypothetical protein